MKKHLRTTGLFLIIVGVALMVDSVVVLKLGNYHHPDSGFLPFWYSLLLVIFSLALVISNLGADGRPQPFWGTLQWVKPLIAALIIGLYGVIMEEIGYMLATFIFLLAWETFLEHEKWLKTLVISVIGTISLYLIFEHMLGVPLPAGIFAL
ncbi:tripartite tricarboxylate transporter TctB family protein [Neomoorella humiferrea]|uniref:tripartite tricarboxylate transporter TctB family protein n=1 Tax=Neomoorella humiferrea TaxID=676965 RepID=UPI003D8A5BE7